MRFYAAEKIGETRSLTPEGFLLCEGVPIARTGEMIYAAGELQGLEAGSDGLIHVYRDAETVFADTSILSYAGKPVTDDHPTEAVTPENWRAYAVGTVMHPRRGEGADGDCIVADLLITDARAIQAVQAGKVEVSCGYDADYEQTAPGVAQQRNIIGNHVALVEAGRCGPRCAIGDQDMAKIPFLDRLRAKLKAKDYEGAEVVLGEVFGATPATTGPDDPGGTIPEGAADEAIPEWAQEIMARLEKLEKMERAEATSDEEAEEEEKKDDEDKEDTQDSAALRPVFDAAISRAEIVAPGIQLPTFDAKAKAKATNDAICALRVTALESAFATTDGRAALEPLAGSAPNFKAMSCDAAEVMLAAAANAMKQRRSTSVGKLVFPVRDAQTPKPMTVADINAANRKRYGIQ